MYRKMYDRRKFERHARIHMDYLCTRRNTRLVSDTVIQYKECLSDFKTVYKGIESVVMLANNNWLNRTMGLVDAMRWLEQQNVHDFIDIFCTWVKYLNLESLYSEERAKEIYNRKIGELKISKIGEGITNWHNKLKSNDNFSNLYDELDDILYDIYNYKTNVEDRVVKYVLEDWKKKLTDLSQFRIGDECGNYMVLACALDNIKANLDVFCDLPVISSSLLTNRLQETFKDRYIGFLYRVHEETFFGVDIEDAQANYVHCFDNNADALANVLVAYDLVDYETYEQVFYPSFRRVLPMDELISQITHFNEILFMSSEKPVGIFCKKERCFEMEDLLRAGNLIYGLPVFLLGDRIQRIF